MPKSANPSGMAEFISRRVRRKRSSTVHSWTDCGRNTITIPAGVSTDSFRFAPSYSVNKIIVLTVTGNGGYSSTSQIVLVP